jgi:hypothetical protein
MKIFSIDQVEEMLQEIVHNCIMAAHQLTMVTLSSSVDLPLSGSLGLMYRSTLNISELVSCHSEPVSPLLSNSDAVLIISL